MPMRERKKTRYDLLKEKRDRVDGNLEISIIRRMSPDLIEQLKTERQMLDAEMEMETAIMESAKNREIEPDGVVLEIGGKIEDPQDKRKNEKRRRAGRKPRERQDEGKRHEADSDQRG